MAPVGWALLLALLNSTPAWAGVSYVTTPPPPPEQQQQGQPGAPAGADEDPAVRSLMEQRRKQQQAYGAINTANPLSESFDPTKMGQANPALEGPAAALLKIFNNPLVQAMGGAAMSPQLTRVLTLVMASPDKNTLLFTEIGLLIVFFVFRAWRKSKAGGWKGRLWVSTYSFLLYLGLAWGIAPFLIFGQPWITALKGA